jgi:hypothetical protein
LVRVESFKCQLEKINYSIIDKIETLQSEKEKISEKFQKITEILCQNKQNFKDMKNIKKIEALIRNLNNMEKEYLISKSNFDERVQTKSTNKINFNLSTDFKSLRDIYKAVREIQSNSSKTLDFKKSQTVISLKKSNMIFINVDTNSIPSSIIGYLNCQTRSIVDLDRFLIQTDLLSVKIIDLRKNFKSVCGLSEVFTFNNKYELIITDFAADSVKYAKKFEPHFVDEIQLCKSVNQFGNFKLKKLYAICTDLDVEYQKWGYKCENLYICDMELHRVLIFDLRMNVLKRIIHGTKDVLSTEEEAQLNEFDCPRDICYSNELVYVLDQEKKMINIFKRNGDYLQDFDYLKSSNNSFENAWAVRVSRDFIFLMDWKQKIVIFDKNFELKFELNHSDVTSMCLFDNCHFLNSKNNGLKLMMHCENGHIIVYEVSSYLDHVPKIIFNRLFNGLKCSSEFMIYESGHRVLLSLGWSKALALISFK